MRIFILSALLITLAGCTLPGSKTPVTPTPTVSTGTTAPANTDITTPVTQMGPASTGSLVTLNYTLRTDSETGPIQETTLESVAKSNNIAKTSAIYEPFQVILGKNQVIPGFEMGLMGVKKGDKKTIKVTPDMGYGRPVTLQKSDIAAEFTTVIEKKRFDKTIVETIEKSNFPPQMQEQIKNAKVGDTLTGSENITAKIIKVTPTNLTIEIDNKTNPFYNKNLTVGAKSTIKQEGGGPSADITISKIEGDKVTLAVVNKASAFYGKKFAVGESATTPDGQKYTIKAINEDTVMVVYAHPFMDKTLYFDIEIVDVQ